MKILLLFSGGLDSILCYYILKEKGYNVKVFQFYTPFLHITNIEEYLNYYRENYNIEITIKNIWDDYKKIIISPEYGFGKNLNPCLDCKLLFYKKAKEIMDKDKFDLIATGEVIGQRPFSQKIDTINFLEKKSDLKNKILRPLSYYHSAKIENESFYNIRGRGRKKQLEIAKKFQINPIPTPAGGCLLTEPTYCTKLKILYDFFDNNIRNFKEVYFELIKHGRVFNIEDNFLLIVGRNRFDSEMLENFFKTEKYDFFKLILTKNYPGPVSALIMKGINKSFNKKIFEKIKEFVKKEYRDKIEFQVLESPDELLSN